MINQLAGTGRQRRLWNELGVWNMRVSVPGPGPKLPAVRLRVTTLSKTWFLQKDGEELDGALDTPSCTISDSTIPRVGPLLQLVLPSMGVIFPLLDCYWPPCLSSRSSHSPFLGFSSGNLIWRSAQPLLWLSISLLGSSPSI